MLVYDDRAAEALHLAADRARHLGADGYETPHVLLGLLRTADPITRTLTASAPQLTEDAVLAALGASSRQRDSRGGPGTRTRRSSPEPAVEFRQATRRFAAKWRPLVRDGHLAARAKLGTGELWLMVLDDGAASERLICSLGAQPVQLRSLLLAAMIPDGTRVPVWPTEVPAGSCRRLLDRLLGSRVRP